MEDFHSVSAVKKEINEMMKDIGLINFEIIINPLSTVGKAGESLRVMVLGMKNDVRYTKEFFAKISPTDEACRELFQMNLRFQCEIFSYEELIPELDSIRGGASIENSLLHYYGGSSLEKGEFLLFDFIRDHIPIPDFSGSHDDELKYAVECIGRFHGLSLALKERRPTRYSALVTKAKKLSTIRNEGWVRSIEVCYDFAIKSLRNPEHAKLLRVYRHNVKALHDQALKKSKYEIICHGDCHLWNFIFKYKEDSPETVESCKMFDFQTLDFGPPTVDLHYLLSSAKLHNLDHLTELHYATMKKTLKELRVDIDRVYPREQYCKDMKDTAIVLFSTSAFCFLFFSGAARNPNLLLELFMGNVKTEDLVCRDPKLADDWNEKCDELYRRFVKN